MFDKSPLTPLCQRGEYEEISPFGKGGLRGILQTLYNIISYVCVSTPFLKRGEKGNYRKLAIPPHSLYRRGGTMKVSSSL
jgi:hypothetical protein